MPSIYPYTEFVLHRIGVTVPAASGLVTLASQEFFIGRRIKIEYVYLMIRETIATLAADFEVYCTAFGGPGIKFAHLSTENAIGVRTLHVPVGMSDGVNFGFSSFVKIWTYNNSVNPLVIDALVAVKIYN